MKIFFGIIATFLISISLFSQNEVDKSNYSLLWEISGNGLKAPSYLFGSMHVRDTEAFEFPDSLSHKLAECDAFANEIHFDSMLLRTLSILSENPEVPKQLMANANQSPKNRSRSTKIKENKVGMPTILDAYLMNIAKHQGKKIFGLENIEEQISKGYSAKEKIASNDIFSFLSQTFSPDLLTIYQQGDLEVLQEKFPYGTTSKDLDRNYEMLRSMERIMQEHTLFTVVGAAHLPGQEGLIELLKKQGYQLRKVTATFENSTNFKVLNTRKTPWVKTKSADNSLLFETPLQVVKMPRGENPLDVYISADIGSGSFFYVMKVNFGFSQLPDKEIFKNLETIWKEENKLDIIASKDIYTNQLKGREYKAISGNPALPFYKMQVFINKGNIFIFMVAGMEANSLKAPAANRFFRKANLIQREGWKDLVKPTEAFRVNFPIDFEYKKELTPDPDDSTSIHIIHLYAGTDSESGFTQLLRWSDLPDGMYMENDSIFFAGIRENFISSLEKEPNKEYNFEKNGYAGKGYLFSDKGTFVKVEAISRGNRSYLLMQTGEGFPNNAFFDSFELLPFQKIVLEKQHYDSSNLSFLMPPYLTLTDNLKDGYYYYLDDYSDYKTYAASDSMTGTSFLLETIQYTPYSYYESLDSLFDETAKNFLTTELDFQQVDTFLYQNKYPARDYYIKEKRSNTHSKYRLIIAGDQLFFAHVLFPKELKDSPQIAAFLNGIQLLKPIEKKKNFLTQPKKNLILKDLLAKDSSTFEIAKKALRKTDFTEEDLPQIYEALAYNYQDDTTQHNYRRVKTTLLRKLGNIESPKNLPFLKTYFANNQLTNLNKDILETIANQNNSEAYQTLFQLLNELPEDKTKTFINNWGVMSPFSDSTALFEKYYPELSQLTQKGLFRSWYFSTSTDILKDSSANSSYILENLDLYKNQADSLLTSDSIAQESWKLSNVIKFYKEISIDKTVLKQVHQIAELSNGWQQLQAIEILLENKAPIESKWLDSLLIDPYINYPTIEQLKELDQLKKVPKKYLEPKTLAGNMLKDAVSYDEDVPEIAYLKTHQLNFQGKEATIYVFWFWFDYNRTSDEKPTKYLGIAGPFFPKDKKGKKFDFSNKLTNYSYKEIEFFGINQRIKELVEEKVEQLKKEETDN